jgi:hypothetical protein
MDGSGASGGEGCLGRFRILRALLVLPCSLLPNRPKSTPELDAEITRFGRSLDGCSSFPPSHAIEFVRWSISHADPGGWLACRNLPKIEQAEIASPKKVAI